MNHLDIVLIIVLLVGFTAGYYKGLIKQLSFGAGIALGLLQAILFYPQVAQQIEEKTQWHSWICVVLAFVGIIVITVLIFKLASLILRGLLKFVHLEFIDKILGALLGCFVALLLTIGLSEVVSAIAPKTPIFGSTSQNESYLYKQLKNTTKLLLVEVKEEIDEKAK
ncbi:MAG: CvpA family protein [Bacteroidaceae bacterium]|nr:CvpA family protein [Bacteroidaceae bacterium]